jgi:hypothetical protein
MSIRISRSAGYAGMTAGGAPTSGTFSVGQWVLDTNGQMYACTEAGTPGRWVRPGPGLEEAPVVGEETFPLLGATSATRDIASGMLRLTYFLASKSETSTQVKMVGGTTAAGATPTTVKMGLYEINSTTGDGTLVGATANDTSLFAVASTSYTRSWVTPFAKVAGRRYALGLLIVTSFAAPTLWGQIQPVTETARAPRVAGYFAGLTDLPTTFLGVNVLAASNRLYGVVLP